MTLEWRRFRNATKTECSIQGTCKIRRKYNKIGYVPCLHHPDKRGSLICTDAKCIVVAKSIPVRNCSVLEPDVEICACATICCESTAWTAPKKLSSKVRADACAAWSLPRYSCLMLFTRELQLWVGDYSLCTVRTNFCPWCIKLYAKIQSWSFHFTEL